MCQTACFCSQESLISNKMLSKLTITRLMKRSSVGVTKIYTTWNLLKFSKKLSVQTNSKRNLKNSTKSANWLSMLQTRGNSSSHTMIYKKSLKLWMSSRHVILQLPIVFRQHTALATKWQTTLRSRSFQTFTSVENKMFQSETTLILKRRRLSILAHRFIMT